MQHTKEVLLMIGISVAILTVVGAVVGGGMINDTQRERIDILTGEIKSGSTGSSVISASVKNMGGHNITSIVGEINYDYDPTTVGLQPFSMIFTPDTLTPGGIIGTNAYLTDISGNEVQLSAGSSYVLIVTGINVDGNPIQDTSTIYVTSGF